MLRRILCRLLSLTPLFAFTIDKNYGDNNDTLSSELRFSVINLRLGNKTYYFLTLTRKEGKLVFRLKDKITLNECQWAIEGEGPLKDKEIYFEKISKDYAEKHLTELNSDEKTIEKEFLGYLQSNLDNRKRLSYDKMNYYTAIVLVFIPLGPTFLKSTCSSYVKGCGILNIFYLVVAGLLLYSLFNWCLLAIQYMSVTGLKKSSFNEIKMPPTDRSKESQQFYSYYHDWQEERFDTNLRVAYVAETELIVKCTVILLIMLVGISFAAAWLKPTTVPRDECVEQFYSINVEELSDPFSEDSIDFAKLQVGIRKNKPQNIIFFVGAESAAADVVDEVIKQYEDFIKVTLLVDPELGPHKLKVMLLGA